MRRLTSILLFAALLLPISPAVADEVSPVVSTDTSAQVSDSNATTTVSDTTTDSSTTESILPTDTVINPSVPTTQILVTFNNSVDVDSTAGSSTAATLAQSLGGEVDTTLGSANAAIVSVPESDAPAIQQALEANPSVDFAEPNYQRLPLTIPTNDTYRGQLWALENTGQFVDTATGTPGDDIKAVPAWNLSLGTSSVVAVIDSGVLYTHPDLVANMWDGTNCVDENGAALGGCIHGYDFADNDKDPFPVATTTAFEHGTHVAGTIAAIRNNNTGVVGVAPSATIMSLRFGFDVASEVRAIDFARENGAKIINASYGGTQYSQAEYDAIKRFTDAGGLFITAAGNYATSTDVNPLYPASYDLPGIISVAATDQNDQLASFSNYGSTTVDIGAPGVNIASTYTDASSSPTYAYADGTSMAVPHVTGVVALIESLYPQQSAMQVKNDILNGGDADASLVGKTVSGKRLNAYQALILAGADYTPPVITLTGSSTIALTVGDTYTELGATATDNVDATTTVVIGGDTVDTSTAGTYHVTYDAVDQAGNHAIQVIRTVVVSNPPATVVSSPASSGGGGGSGGGGSSGGGSSSSVSYSSGGGGGSSSSVSNPARPAQSIIVSTSTTPTPMVLGTSTQALPSFLFTRNLSVGSRGADVTALQHYLQARGLFTGSFTTYFGILTRASVKKYQVAHSLPAVGNVGPMTRALLNKGI